MEKRTASNNLGLGQLHLKDVCRTILTCPCAVLKFVINEYYYILHTRILRGARIIHVVKKFGVFFSEGGWTIFRVYFVFIALRKFK